MSLMLFSILLLVCLQAQEVLRSSRGALMWHGRDLRHFKRIISPPLQQLLTQPGTAVLGRGLASMPAASAHQMGAAQVGDMALFFSDNALSRCNKTGYTLAHVNTSWCAFNAACRLSCTWPLMLCVLLASHLSLMAPLGLPAACFALSSFRPTASCFRPAAAQQQSSRAYRWAKETLTALQALSVVRSERGCLHPQSAGARANNFKAPGPRLPADRGW